MFDSTGRGGADGQWLTVTLFLYDLGWGNQKNLGRASAVALLLFLVIGIIGILHVALSNRIAASDQMVKKSRKKIGGKR